MTSQSNNLNLKYWNAGDTSVPFSDFRLGLTSSDTQSNMYRLDSFAGMVMDSACLVITANAGSGGTTYVATDVKDLGGIDNLSSTIPNGTRIILKVQEANLAGCTLTINGSGNIAMTKALKGATGLVNLQAGDLSIARNYMFSFNGSTWVLLNAVGLPQVIADGTVGDLTFSSETQDLTIRENAVTLSQLAQLPSATVIGNAYGNPAATPQALTSSELAVILQAQSVLVYKGTIDCSYDIVTYPDSGGYPPYPSGLAGWMYVVSADGKIGGSGGQTVSTGDFIICNTTTSIPPLATEWDIVSGNLGDVVGPASSINNNLSGFDGVTGKLIKDSGIASSAVVTLTGSQVLTNKTLTSPTITNGGTITLPTSTDTLVGKTTSDTLTNKVLSDSTSYFANVSDTSKILKTSIGGATASKTMTIASSHTDNRTLTLPDTTDTLVGKLTTDTLGNKRITPRWLEINTGYATPSYNIEEIDCLDIVSLNTAITSMTTGMAGVATNFQKLIIRINATTGGAYGITWGAKFASRGATLPTTIATSKTITVGLIYNDNSVTSGIWDCVAVATEA